MSFINEHHNTSEISDIVSIQFGVLSPEEIKKRSVVHVTRDGLYDNNEPIIGGLFDPRMGVLDREKICPTDELDNVLCPGYFGHIELAKPVIYTQYISTIHKILKCTCLSCSRLLINIDEKMNDHIMSMEKNKRLNYILSLCSKAKTCGDKSGEGCGATKPKNIKRDGFSKIIAYWGDNLPEVKDTDAGNLILTPELILKIFKRISDNDCELLGLSRHFCRPEWLICTVLPVPPPYVRPSVRTYNDQRSEDDITHKLVDIIKTNNIIKNKLNSETGEQIINGWTDVLQYHVSTLIDNEIPNINSASNRSGRILKTLKQRLKSKDGRVRGNLMGKRVNFSARSVITPDPNISIDELGVPIKIAKNLTFPETVTEYNIEIMYKLVRNGPENHPGAKSIKRLSDGKTRRLHNLDRDKIVLFHGDIVNRHINDGDVVLFNRQPSLHKMSMMAHRIKVMKGKTFRLNLSACKPYNADFDGDEMNMHVAQSYQAFVELKNISSVKNQVISPSVNKPLIYLVQDSLLGISRITRDNVFFNKDDYMNLLMKVNRFNGEFPEPAKIENNVPFWSGKQLISEILPEINVTMGNKQYDPDRADSKKNFVNIQNGELKQGIIDKKILTQTSKGLTHIIFNDYGPDRTQEFIDNSQFIITNYLLNTGFSVGVSDLIANDKVKLDMKNTINRIKKEAQEVIQHIHLNVFENLTNKTNREAFEIKIKNILEKATPEAGKLGLKSLDVNNRLVNMVASGSKGSDINIAQMISCLGQQSVDGKRIPYGYSNRTLPHYHKYDDSPESRGFVENSFIKGLTPQEFFFHAMGGREGLIDTAVKTAEIGYIQRKLMKFMEDLRVRFDLSVRDEQSNIVEFIYGGDGVDAAKMEELSLIQRIEGRTIKYKNIEPYMMIEMFKFNENEEWKEYLLPKTIEDISSNKEHQKIFDRFFEKIENDKNYINELLKDEIDDKIVFSIDFNRILKNTETKFMIDNDLFTDLNPIYVIDELEKLTNENDNKLLNILIRFFLSPKLLIKYRRITQTAFDFVLSMVRIKIQQSKVNVGEMVGPLAAQSIGEPATQMTLNTFHFAGVSSKSNVTRGVPRVKEILHVAKKLKNYSLTIYLDDEHRFNREKSQELLSNLELTTLRDIVKSTRIYYEPYEYNTNIEEDIEFLKLYQIFNNSEELECEDTYSPWLLRFEFNKKEMMNRNITMDDIHLKINQIYNTEKNILSCVYTDDNYDKQIFRIKIAKNKKKEQDETDDIKHIKSIENQLLNTILKGVNNITKVNMRKNEGNYEYVDGAFTHKPEWILDTVGINIMDIISQNGVDPTRTFTNDIIEAFDMFGIEAARNTIVNELVDVIESSAQYVNNRHINLLADTMTYKGKLTSVDRFGINRGDKGVFAMCSFEETPEILFQAGLYGKKDNLNGVSGNIMTGQLVKAGTGASDVLLDEVKYINQTQEEGQLYKESDFKQLPGCSIENLDFGFNIDSIQNEDLSSITVPEIKFIEA